jgi:hypothetical protein
MFVLLFGAFAVTYATGRLKRPELCAQTSWEPVEAAYFFPATPGLNLIADNRLESFWR